jgi:hypothetical protein
MNGRERFTQTMRYGSTDRPPLFEDGIRDEVVRNWHKQGLGRKEKIDELFVFDKREEIEPNLEPSPALNYWPKSVNGLKNLGNRLDPDDSNRLPDDWDIKVGDWKTRDYPLILRVHRGYFLSMGVHGWRRFTDAIQILVDDPYFVETWMNVYAEFISRMVAKILDEIQVDAALFSEPIGGNHGPLISPTMYSSMVLKSYLPILDVLHSYGVGTIIYRTYANTRDLLPSVVKAGFNCLWACECNPQAMDYQEIRREFGNDLRLIGGIDADALRQSQPEILQAIIKVVPDLLNDGGFIPLADGRVRDDVPYENYVYYRRLLESVVKGAMAG